MRWYAISIGNYFNFNGRARRREYWIFLLVYSIMTIVFGALDIILIAAGIFPFFIFLSIIALFHFVPLWSVSVRRLHDIDRTGLWLLSPSFFSIIGWFLLWVGYSSLSLIWLFTILGFICFFVSFGLQITIFVFMCLDGTKGYNASGPSNKYDEKGNLLKY